jgi:hypothetical protein
MTDQAPTNTSTEIEKTKSETSFEWAEKWLPIIAVSFIVFMLGVYVANFNDGFGDANAFGTFGDFVGGALNPLLGFLTVWLLIKSIRFQIDELRLTREEVVKANVIRQDSEKTQLAILEAQERNTVVPIAVQDLNKCILKFKDLIFSRLEDGFGTKSPFSYLTQQYNNEDLYQKWLKFDQTCAAKSIEERLRSATPIISRIAFVIQELDAINVNKIIYLDYLIQTKDNIYKVEHGFKMSLSKEQFKEYATAVKVLENIYKKALT